ncbi:MAG: cyclase family protein [Minwuia sp.]|uniref:cyclase family protein n=1 Tax=Minwuia sp. TaxID=2493630 RepID=UPI003A8BA781
MRKLLIGAGLGLALAASPALAQDCQPSKYGADDEIGAANLVTPERVMAATKLVKKGMTHPLGIVVDPNMPAFPPRGMMLQIVSPGQQNGRTLGQDFGWDSIYNDDIAQLWFGIGPQIDGLGHLGEGTYYNCNDPKDISALTGLTKLGIHNIPPLVARGVLIDIAKHRGVESLNAGDAITGEELDAAAKAQGVTFKDGDVILIHTGWTDAKLASDPTAWVSGEPGTDNAAAVWLASKNPVAVGADTWGVDVVPPAPGDKVFYGHVTLLKENGIYILETMNTGRLAAEGVNEFMFVLGQARIKGAVQMIINPVAMW